jgi:hypothetical protein
MNLGPFDDHDTTPGRTALADVPALRESTAAPDHLTSSS